ncbi:hypothetical protein ANH9776_03940 [Aggregatibacter actinomycetemcomitans serotype e str. ANH9776]|nr:hypothetical protein ANH9776_03940 [Aggregatibacter actinomycetemcomitans serotype e str. ANH9776]
MGKINLQLNDFCQKLVIKVLCLSLCGITQKLVKIEMLDKRL